MNFYMPTKVIMQDDCVMQNIDLFNEFGKKALIVCGKSSAYKNGAIDDVKKALSSAAIQCVIFDKVENNPGIELAYQGAQFAKTNEIDFVIAIGGGSAMDLGKVIALLARQNIKKENLLNTNYASDVLPIICIPTTVGTGSEVTQYAVLTNNEAQTKSSISSIYLFPKLALLDGKYLKNLPYSATVNTALDALSHAVESMLSKKNSDFINEISVQSVKIIGECLLKPKEKQIPDNAKKKLLYASMLAGISIANTGTVMLHGMGYNLTYFKNIDHGLANAMLFAEFLRQIQKFDEKFVDNLMSIMGLANLNEFENTINFLTESDLAITESEVELYTQKAMNAKNFSNCIYNLPKQSIQAIFKKSLTVK